jgi:hypothetical protein
VTRVEPGDETDRVSTARLWGNVTVPEGAVYPVVEMVMRWTGVGSPLLFRTSVHSSAGTGVGYVRLTVPVVPLGIGPLVTLLGWLQGKVATREEEAAPRTAKFSRTLVAFAGTEAVA